MKNRPRGGLGRGLGALIPTGPVPPTETTTATADDGEAAKVPPAIVAPVATPVGENPETARAALRSFLGANLAPLEATLEAARGR